MKNLLLLITSAALMVSLASLIEAQEPTANVFLPAPRVVKQHLSRARKAIEDEQFSDAVSHLGTILTETFDEEVIPGVEAAAANTSMDENQDYFVEFYFLGLHKPHQPELFHQGLFE